MTPPGGNDVNNKWSK